LPPVSHPHSLENGTGWEARYAPGEEGGDLEARASPFTAPMRARRGTGWPSRG
jgi:hypothetical protein